MNVSLLLGASFARAVEVEILADRVYGHKDGMALTLDVIKPKTGANGAAIAYMVSYGWVSPWTSPTEHAKRFQPLLERGFVIIPVYHGGSPKYVIPEIVDDVRRAVRYIRHNANQWSVDKERLGVHGVSAGGHLSLVLGLESDQGDPDAKEAFLRESDRVASVVAYFAPVDLRQLSRGIWPPTVERGSERFPAVNFDPDKAPDYSPLLHVSADDPPTLVVHGDADTLVPASNSRDIFATLQKAGVRSDLIIIPGAGHGFLGPNAAKADNAMADWFEQTLVKNPPQK